MTIAFRAYAEAWRGKRHYYVYVRVTKTRKAMHRDMRAQHFKPLPGVMGQCSGVTHYNRAGRRTGRFAVMWLNVDDLRGDAAELISHESIHAAMRHMTNRKIDLSNMEGEEALCYCAGSLTQQINDRLHKLGVL